MDPRDYIEITPAPPLYEDTTWKERCLPPPPATRPVVGSLARPKTTRAKTMKEKREAAEAAKKAEKDAKKKKKNKEKGEKEERKRKGRRYRLFRWFRNLF